MAKSGRTDGTPGATSRRGRDLTERETVPAAKAASSDLLHSVMDGSPFAMGVAGPDHRWLQANVALCDLLGIPVGEIIDRSTLESIHPDDRGTIKRLEDRLFDRRRDVRSVERRYIHPSGRVLLANVTARIIDDPRSAVSLALYTIEDLTARRRDEEAARVAEARLRGATLAISAVQEPSAVLRAVLASTREALQAEFSAMIVFKPDHSAITRIDADGIDAAGLVDHVRRWPSGVWALGLAGRSGRPVRIRDVRRHPGFVGQPHDHPRLVSFLAVPVPLEGSDPATLFVANKVGEPEFSESDEMIAVALAMHAAVCIANARINARATGLVAELDRANVELKQASEAKSRFLANVAHELRTPLHSILLASELAHDSLQGQPLGSRMQDLCATIESSGRHMVRLIDDLVDLSRIDAGRLELRPSALLIADVIVEVVASFNNLAAEQDIALEFERGPGPGPTVSADPDRLRQILTNVVANALKFTPAGGRVSLEVRAKRGTVTVTIRDTGVGIASEHLERAFLPFEQVSGTATKGAGLGLAISRSLAELHGGRLDASSDPGVGSTFTLTLPGRPGAPSSGIGPGSLPAITSRNHGRPILLVEDDATAMGLTTNLLEMAGYEVHQATGVASAIDRLAEQAPALILLDIRLGDGSGLDLVHRIRAQDDLRHVPIIGLSADILPDDVQRARTSGCDDFLPKPVSSRVLLARIGKLIEVS